MKKHLHFNDLYTDLSLPVDKLKKEPLDANIVYDLIKSELNLEYNERQNLATFCQTYMEEEANKLITLTLGKNSIDKTEYPKVADIEQKCLKIIENLWNGHKCIGTSTIGSSEGCILGGLSMKKRWQKANPHLSKPNLIISSTYQVCWEKFGTYFDVELKKVPINKNSMTLDIKKAIDMIDENTIGIVGILGVTYTGLYDNIELLNDELTLYNKDASFPIHIHVDAASGGLYAPFIKPQMKWDFSLENVISINTSGHKYGLTYPGIGWVLFKNIDHVDPDILFEVSYLGGRVPTMGVNFSNNASHMLSQYYNFCRLGFEGYEKVHNKTKNVGKYIYQNLNSLDLFNFINKSDNLPILCYSLKDEHSWDLYDLSDELTKYGWQVPSYTLSEDLDKIVVQRIVIRADLTHDLAKNLIDNFKQAINNLENKDNKSNTRLDTFKH